MLQADLYEIVREQLALDLGCDPALLDTPENVVVEWQDRPGRRAVSYTHLTLPTILLV